jgi:hypothetical protein
VLCAFFVRRFTTGMKLAVIQNGPVWATHVDRHDPVDSPRIIKLLIKHFPEHGPFLGVYAVVDEPGSRTRSKFKVVEG